jgi:hypothetical protein
MPMRGRKHTLDCGSSRRSKGKRQRLPMDAIRVNPAFDGLYLGQGALEQRVASSSPSHARAARGCRSASGGRSSPRRSPFLQPFDRP